MSYSYYQNTAPGWGTNQFQFGAPPAPGFQPQPSWGGLDYYRAHALSPDPSLFNQAFDRVRNYRGDIDIDGGVGKHEARHWHRRVYGGLDPISAMLPSEIGHAAAYEAYRTWIHNSSIYEPLSGDFERQREGLIGLAIAEATRMLQYSGRTLDRYSRVEASEAAAATASIIYSQSREEDMAFGGRRSRRPSFSNYGGSVVDPYAYDDYGGTRRARRASSASRSRPIMTGGYNGYGGASPVPGYGPPSPGGMPIPGSAPPVGGPGGFVGPSSYGSSYGGASPYGGGGSSYGGASPYVGAGSAGMPMSMPAGGGYGGTPYGGGGVPFPGTAGYAGQGTYPAQGGYAGGAYPAQTIQSGGGYGQPQVTTVAPGSVPPGSVVVVNHKPRKHRHRNSSTSGHHHHHHHLRRASSVEPMGNYVSSYRY